MLSKKDLSFRHAKPELGIGETCFQEYFKLPPIIIDRLFSFFDKDSNNYIDLKEFVLSMELIFSGVFEDLASFCFFIYDFDDDGLIEAADVFSVLKLIPMENASFSLSETKMKFNKGANFRVTFDNQLELFQLIKNAFNENLKLNKKMFIYTVESVNSDIFTTLIFFILENNPFKKKTLIHFALSKPTSYAHKHYPKRLITFPTKSNKFSFIRPSIVSPEHKSRKIEAGDLFFTEMELFPTVRNVRLINSMKKESKEELNESWEQSHGSIDVSDEVFCDGYLLKITKVNKL